MDTKAHHLESDFYVRLAGDGHPDFVQDYYRKRVDDPDDNMVNFDNAPLRDYHLLNQDVPIDGQVCFYYPDSLEVAGEGVWSHTFPFRDHRKDGDPWAAFPDKPEHKSHPVWKWQNPEEDPYESLTLKPSLGVGHDGLSFHCWVRDGEVEWL